MIQVVKEKNTKHMKLQTHLKSFIALHPEGTRLPSYSRLMNEHSVSQSTVVSAVNELVLEKLIICKHRSGMFISPRAPQKNHIIILACPKFMLDTEHHPAIGTYIAGANQKAEALNLDIQAKFYREGKFLEDIGHKLLHSDCDGVIGTWDLLEQDCEFLKTNHIPLVNCGKKSSLPTNDEWAISISINHLKATRMLIEHLLEMGHKRIIFVNYNCGKELDIDHVFTQLALEYRMGKVQDLIIRIRNPHTGVNWEDMENFFKISPRPTAVIVADGFMLDRLLAGCRRCNISIPDELSVATLLDLNPAGHQISVTSAIGPEDMSRNICMASVILKKEINNTPVVKRQITVLPKLKLGASTMMA